MELYTRNAVKYSFLRSCIDRMLNYGLKSQQMVLHANLQSEMVLTIFTSFFVVFLGGKGGNHIQQLIISLSNYDRNKMFASFKQSGNYLFQTWYVNVYTHNRTNKIKL